MCVFGRVAGLVGSQVVLISQADPGSYLGESGLIEDHSDGMHFWLLTPEQSVIIIAGCIFVYGELRHRFSECLVKPLGPQQVGLLSLLLQMPPPPLLQQLFYQYPVVPFLNVRLKRRLSVSHQNIVGSVDQLLELVPNLTQILRLLFLRYFLDRNQFSKLNFHGSTWIISPDGLNFYLICFASVFCDLGQSGLLEINLVHSTDVPPHLRLHLQQRVRRCIPPSLMRLLQCQHF